MSVACYGFVARAQAYQHNQQDDQRSRISFQSHPKAVLCSELGLRSLLGMDVPFLGAIEFELFPRDFLNVVGSGLEAHGERDKRVPVFL